MSQGKKIIQPPYLKEGDKVALIAPAYWVAQEALSMAVDVLKSWELKHVFGYDRAESYGLYSMQMQGAIIIFAANIKRILKLI